MLHENFVTLQQCYLRAVDDVRWGLVGKELVAVLSGVSLGALGRTANARRGHDSVNASDGLVISRPTQNKSCREQK